MMYLYELPDKELATAIREADQWDGDMLMELVRRAGMMDEYEAAELDSWDIVYAAAEALGVEIE